MCPTARETQTGVEYPIRPPVNRRVVNHKRTEMEQGRGEKVADVREADSHLATAKRVNAHPISDLSFQNYHSVCVRKPRCSSGF